MNIFSHLSCLYIVAVIGIEGSSEVSIQEDHGEVQFCVAVQTPSIDCPINFPFTLNISIVNGTTGEVSYFTYIIIRECFYCYTVSSGEDVATTSVIIFNTCDEVSCGVIKIVNDDIAEEPELFEFMLERTSDLNERIYLQSITWKLSINDDDGKIALSNNIFLFNFPLPQIQLLDSVQPCSLQLRQLDILKCALKSITLH